MQPVNRISPDEFQRGWRTNWLLVSNTKLLTLLTKALSSTRRRAGSWARWISTLPEIATGNVLLGQYVTNTSPRGPQSGSLASHPWSP